MLAVRLAVKFGKPFALNGVCRLQLKPTKRLLLTARGWPLAFDLQDASVPPNQACEVWRATYDRRVGNRLVYKLTVGNVATEITVKHSKL